VKFSELKYTVKHRNLLVGTCSYSKVLKIFFLKKSGFAPNFVQIYQWFWIFMKLEVYL